METFLSECLQRVNIDRRITKIGTNDRYHQWNTGLKSPYCQSKMAAKNPSWQTRNLVFLTFQHQTVVISRASSRSPFFKNHSLMYNFSYPVEYIN